MDAPSDGAIVITRCTTCSTRKPTLRQLVRWFWPDAFLTTWLMLSAFMLGGMVYDCCIR